MGDYKLLVGNPGAFSGWYPPDRDYNKKMFEEEYTFEERLKAGNESYYKLFNLKEDPNEYYNLADSLPDIVKKLEDRMAWYHEQMIPAKIPPVNPLGNPKYYGGVWTPGWCAAPVK